MIGVGMLVLFLVFAGIGFLILLMIMFGLWMLMVFIVLLMVEIYQYVDKEVILYIFVKQILGDKGKWVVMFVMLFLFYLLCVVYIVGGGV